jgi:hypothetical protein
LETQSSIIDLIFPQKYPVCRIANGSRLLVELLTISSHRESSHFNNKSSYVRSYKVSSFKKAVDSAIDQNARHNVFFKKYFNIINDFFSTLTVFRIQHNTDRMQIQK